MLDALRYDFSYAVRGLRRSPGLTIGILLAFVLGIGVNAALFSVVDRVFFQAPPGVVNPGQVRRLIVFVHQQAGVVFPSQSYSTRMHEALREAVGGAAEVEGFYANDVRVDDQSERRSAAYATTGFFHLVGVHPDRGRFFSADENQYGAPTNVAILSYDYWQRTFQGDSAIIGRVVRIDSLLFTVIGVAQRHFDGLDLDAVDIWLPLASLPAGGEGAWWENDLGVLRLFTRVFPAGDVPAVEARLNARYRAMEPEQLARDPNLRLEAAPLLQARGALGLGRQDDRALALILPIAAVALLILVISTTNVASLLLMRALRRRRESAVRVALGVSPRRLILQVVIECALLALAGAGVALLVAAWTGSALRRTLLSDIHWTTTVIDARLVAFVLVIALVAGVGAGLAPATIILRRDLVTLLRGGAESGRPRSAFRIGLLAVQTALCMMMLAAAGVFLQSLRRATELNLGFDASRLVSIRLGAMPQATVDEAVQRIRALPSVDDVAQSNGPLSASYGGGLLFFANGDSIGYDRAPVTKTVDASFDRVLGLRLLEGRFFGPQDAKGTQPVVVVDQTFADAFGKRGSLVGQCLRRFKRNNPCLTIVGVVSSYRWELSADPPQRYYTVGAQSPYARWSYQLIVRTHGPAWRETAANIQRILATLITTPSARPAPAPVTDLLEPQLRPWRIGAWMFSVFGLLALAAAVAGIYALVNYDVTQRTHEIGVRITLGATARGIVQVIVASGLRVIGFGLVAGLACAFALGRFVQSLLFETSAYDLRVLMATAATICVAALVASLVPAWRAARVDPMVALRAE